MGVKFMGVKFMGVIVTGNATEKLPKFRIGWTDRAADPAEPAEKLQKFRIGWTRRAATKTTNFRFQ